MANNFRKIGDFYVSKAGDDSNNGTSSDTPFKTLKKAFQSLISDNQKIIIGAGVYNESITGSDFTYRAIDVEADGYVVLYGQNGIDIISGIQNGYIFIGIEIRNYTQFEFTTHNFASGIRGSSFINCVIRDSTIIHNGQVDKFFEKTKIINSTIENGENNYNKNILVGVSFTSSLVKSIIDCFIDENTDFVFSSGIDYSSSFLHCNVKGQLREAGDSYGLTDLSTFKTNYSLTGRDDLFNADPKFNNISLLDFTITTDSPHFQFTFDGLNNIGNTMIGEGYYGGDSQWDTSGEATEDSNITGTTDRTLSSGTEGTITSAPIQTPNGILLTPSKINYVGALLFNSDESGGTSENKNVPDSLNYSDGDAGRNPNRLSYEMRWSINSTKPQQDSDWDNDGLVTAGNYSHFIWNDKPMIDSNGIGNGEQNFNSNNSQSIEFVWYQIRVTLRNDYNS